MIIIYELESLVKFFIVSLCHKIFEIHLTITWVVCIMEKM